MAQRQLAEAQSTAEQPRTMPSISISALAEAVESRLRGVLQGLKETGYVDGRNLAIEYRRGNGQIDRLRKLVADPVRRKVTSCPTTDV